jgi:hypothetical protein
MLHHQLLQGACRWWVQVVGGAYSMGLHSHGAHINKTKQDIQATAR